MIQSVLNEPFQTLDLLNEKFICEISERTGITTEFIFSKSLPDLQGAKDDLVAEICLSNNCNEYLSALGSGAYIEKDAPGGAIVQNNISLYYHQFEHPVYIQMGKSFIPYLSTIDLLFNHGFNSALEIIRGGRKKPLDYLDYRKQHGLNY